MLQEYNDLVDSATAVIKDIIRQGRPIVISWSAGKDSSLLANLTLTAAAECRKEGHIPPPLFVTHADTLIENPEMHRHAMTEMERMRDFARDQNIDLQILIAQPRLTEHWAVQVIGRRALPTYPESQQRRCAADYKITPMKRLNAEILEKTKGLRPVRLVGSRFSESQVRGNRMRKRGDSDTIIRTDSKDRMDSLSPIALFSTEDVWMYLAEVRDGLRPGYSDFKSVFALYKEASGDT